MFLAVIFVQSLTALATSEPCTLWSRNGVSIQGAQNETTVNKVEFCSFYGIRYAKAPIKKYRFQKAQLVRLFNAKSKPTVFRKLPPECVQDRLGGVIGQEDCLFVNVFTKSGTAAAAEKPSAVDNVNLRPVVVWIHGGTFIMGSGLSDDFNPSGFIEEDIVVVSFNYRLDIFGFFPVSSDEPYSMNLGLDDQKVALKWVQRHIKIFGGDPNKVTIMGWSAGSASVCYLLYDQEAKGLFHAAIAMSGSFLSPWAFSHNILKSRERICLSYQINNCTLDGIFASMGGNFTQLIDTQNMFSRNLVNNVFGSMFPIFAPGPPYPGDSPELRMRMGPVNDVPLLVGVTNDESKNFDLGVLIDVKPQSTFFFPNHDDEPKIMDEVVAMIKAVRRQSEDKYREHLSFADLYHGAYKFVELHSLRAQEKIYLYRFNYNPADGSTVGAAHGDDLKLLFQAYNPNVYTNEIVSQSMLKLWTGFIKFG